MKQADPHVFSKFLKFKAKDSKVAIFHELHPSPIYLNRQAWQTFLDNPSNNSYLVDQFRNRKLIISSPKEDIEELERVKIALEQKLNRTSILYLMMAQHCNMRCHYCPIPGLAQKFGERLLSAENAQAGVDLWAKHIADFPEGDEYDLIFYGGEPLLNKDTISSTLYYVDRCKQKKVLPRNGVNTIIATNGVLIDNSMIELFRRHSVTAVVGIDGFGPMENRARVYLDNRSTLNDALRAIRQLVEGGVTTCASVSITPDNIRFIDEYYSFFEELGVQKFGFNFLKGKALTEYPGTNPESFYRQAAKAVIRGFSRQENLSFEFQMEKKYNAFTNQDFFPIDCPCYGSQLVIQPDGYITNCPFYRNDIVHVQEAGEGFRIWEAGVVSQWRQRLSLYNPAYQDFDAKSLCGGGCTWSNIEQNINYLDVDLAAWIFSEEVFDYFLWSNYNEEEE
jgi:radical SAM protein with 4Fe4S-binding SPASM domain